MDDFLKFLTERRSVRKFKQEAVPDEIITKLLEAGRHAPSRANSQPWKFIVVTNEDNRKALSKAAYGQKLIANAPLSIVILGVVDPRKSVPDRTSELVDAGAFGNEVKEFADHILDDWKYNELKVDCAMNSAIAAAQIMLAAEAFGLGCCWVKLCKDDDVLKSLNVPEGYYHTGILAIGYPDETPKHKPRLPLSKIVYYEKYGQK